jgi:hypothetical protein
MIGAPLMKDSRHDDRAGKTQSSSGAGKLPLDKKDLTCNEAEVEELLSEGESTDGEADEEEQADKPAERNPPSRFGEHSLHT